MTNERDTVQALENCRLFAARHRKEEWAATILRFCAEAGATGSPLRAAQPQESQEPSSLIAQYEKALFAQQRTYADPYADAEDRRDADRKLDDAKNALLNAFAAPAQPAQPPADGWVDANVSGNPTLMQAMRNHAEAAAAPQPPAREPLTGEQLRDVARTLDPAHTDWLRSDWPCARMFARAIEAAHGITGGKA